MAKTARKKAKAPAKKKAATRKAPAKRKTAVKKTAAGPGADAAARLSDTVREVEELLEKGAGQLADARERVERAAATANRKRTLAAHAAADRAREAVALINARRLRVATSLREAREAIADELGTDLKTLQRALKETVEHYEEALKANDRRVPRRPRDPRNR